MAEWMFLLLTPLVGFFKESQVRLKTSCPDDELLKPNSSQPPPTKEECEVFQSALDRVARFYGEGSTLLTAGAGNQREFIDQARAEKQFFQSADERIQDQLKALEPFPADHTYRKCPFSHSRKLDEELRSEQRYVGREIRAREAAEEKLEVLWQKREEITGTMLFLKGLLKDHCSQWQSE